MMHCRKCGRILEKLPDLHFHSGKSWYGCENCDIVVEYNYCSTSGRDMGTSPCFLAYKKYKERILTKEEKIMLPTCEVDGCENHPEHTIGVADVTLAVCRPHRDNTRKLSRKYAKRLFEARIAILEEFEKSVFNMGKE